MELEEKISKNYNEFTDGERFIANYVINNRDMIAQLSINELATECLSSKSSILRFCQKIGFKGYTEFKSFLKWDSKPQRFELKSTDFNEKFTNGYGEIIEYYLNLNLNNFIKSIYQAENIYTIGTGKQQKNWLDGFGRCLLDFNKKIHKLEYGMNNLVYKNMINEITEKDIILVKSHSGDNTILKEALNLPLLKEIKIISLTTNGNNWVAYNSTEHIALTPSHNFDFITVNSDYLLIDIFINRYNNYQWNK